MGALTSHRKRGESSVASLFNYFSISKKTRFSGSMDQNTPDVSWPGPSSSVISRISRYPESKPRFPREVHAPVRSFPFGLAKKLNKAVENSADRMRKINGNYRNAMKIAIDSLRYVSKDPGVKEVDEDEEKRVDVSDDSSVEEVVEIQLRSVDYSSGVTEDLSNVDAKEMQLVALDHQQDAIGVRLHRKLYYSAVKRNDKLDSLTFYIEYLEQQRKRLQLLQPQKEEAVQPVKDAARKECFVPLSEEEEAEVTCAMSKSNRRKVLVSHDHSNIDISGEKLQCLCPGGWLNDEVINLYLELLKEREKREPEKFLKCHFFNTFFYKKLIAGKGGYNFQSVRRWTTPKKLGYSLLECDKIFVPIHKEVHWCLAIINKKDEKFQYLDSLRGNDAQVMKVLARYFVDEVKDKNGKVTDVSSWEQEFVEDLPEQKNGFDCGMFMLKYADFYGRDIGLCFSQQHMPYFRRRTAKEILKLRAN